MVEMVEHGTLNYEELLVYGYTPGDLIVFSSNVNPYGPPPAVTAALHREIDRDAISRYPDRLSLDLRSRLATHHGVPENAIIVGNGTADLMWLLAFLFLRGKRVVIFSPTFGEYRNIVNLAGGQWQPVCHPGWVRQPDGVYTPFDTGVEEATAALAAQQAEVVFLCNPNNPTGQHWTEDVVQRFYEAAPRALWVIDEAYTEFTPSPWSAVGWHARGNVIALRSMTKDFSLGGLRLGYAVAPAELVVQMQHAQPPWNVNALAQIAGITALEQLAWRRETMARLRRECASLQQALVERGFAPMETTTNYFLTPVTDAAQVRKQLLAQRLMVRDCTSFGLPRYIRIATQRPEQNRVLVEALARLRLPGTQGA
jgi:histidinol-phosphate aminotransferase